MPFHKEVSTYPSHWGTGGGYLSFVIVSCQPHSNDSNEHPRKSTKESQLLLLLPSLLVPLPYHKLHLT
jgi:hypothetical protein